MKLERRAVPKTDCTRKFLLFNIQGFLLHCPALLNLSTQLVKKVSNAFSHWITSNLWLSSISCELCPQFFIFLVLICGGPKKLFVIFLCIANQFPVVPSNYRQFAWADARLSSDTSWKIIYRIYSCKRYPYNYNPAYIFWYNTTNAKMHCCWYILK